MNIQYFTKDNQKQWNDFIAQNAIDGGLLQSFGWGELNEKMGRKVWYIGITEGEEILAVAMVIKYNLPLGQGYFYVPRGPVEAQEHKNIKTLEQKTLKRALELLLEEIDGLAKKEGAMFCNVESCQLLHVTCYMLHDKTIQPKQTLVLDITKNEDEILAAMSQKTRYNIRLAQKKNIKVVKDKNEKYFEAFWQLMQKTGKRDNFQSHAKNYYQKLLAMGNMELFNAEIDGKIIASVMVAFFGKTAYYLHGASDYDFRDSMAPYLLQWEAIKEAKNRNYQFYDFWGVATPTVNCQPSIVNCSSWAGFTRFKLGFAPNTEVTAYPGLYQKTYQPIKYLMYKMTALLSPRKMRGYCRAITKKFM